jgi:hypothetical protein
MSGLPVRGRLDITSRTSISLTSLACMHIIFSRAVDIFAVRNPDVEKLGRKKTHSFKIAQVNTHWVME